MTALTPEHRAELRRALHYNGHPNFSVNRDTLEALLDAADERDALAAVAREADQMHAVMLAAEGELLGDSPELPRWERLLLNGLTLPELAKAVAGERDRLRTWQKRVAFACQSYVDLVDERDRLAAQMKAVLALADNPYSDARNISGTDIKRTIETALKGIAEDANHMKEGEKADE